MPSEKDSYQQYIFYYLTSTNSAISLLAMRRHLEIATNVAIVIFLGFISIDYGVGFIRARTKVPSLPIQIKAGDQLVGLPINWRSHARTLVLALRYGCHYCQDSVPFYKHLLDLQAVGRLGDVRISAIFPDDATIAAHTLQGENLKLDLVPAVDFSRFRIFATPTAILVDSEGHVQRVWVGELNAKSEGALVASVSGEAAR